MVDPSARAARERSAPGQHPDGNPKRRPASRVGRPGSAATRRRPAERRPALQPPSRVGRSAWRPDHAPAPTAPGRAAAEPPRRPPPRLVPTRRAVRRARPLPAASAVRARASEQLRTQSLGQAIDALGTVELDVRCHVGEVGGHAEQGSARRYPPRDGDIRCGQCVDRKRTETHGVGDRRDHRRLQSQVVGPARTDQHQLPQPVGPGQQDREQRGRHEGDDGRGPQRRRADHTGRRRLVLLASCHAPRPASRWTNRWTAVRSAR